MRHLANRNLGNHISELISETGGSLGLFLGLSLVDIFLCGTGNFHTRITIYGISYTSVGV